MYDDAKTARVAQGYAVPELPASRHASRRREAASGTDGFASMLQRSMHDTERMDRSARERIQTTRDDSSPELFATRDGDVKEGKITPRQKRKILHDIQQSLRAGTVGLSGAVRAAAQAAGVPLSGALGVATEAAMGGGNPVAEANADAVEVEALASASQYFWDLLFNPATATDLTLQSLTPDQLLPNGVAGSGFESGTGLVDDPLAAKSALDWLRDSIRSLSLAGDGGTVHPPADPRASASGDMPKTALAEPGTIGAGGASMTTPDAAGEGLATLAAPTGTDPAASAHARGGGGSFGGAGSGAAAERMAAWLGSGSGSTNRTGGEGAAEGLLSVWTGNGWAVAKPAGSQGGCPLPGGMSPASGSLGSGLGNLSSTPSSDAASAAAASTGSSSGKSATQETSGQPGGAHAATLGENVRVVSVDQGANADHGSGQNDGRRDHDNGHGDSRSLRAAAATAGAAAAATAGTGTGFDWSMISAATAGAGMAQSGQDDGEIAKQVARVTEAMKWVNRNGGKQVTVNFTTDTLGDMRLRVMSKQGRVSATLTVASDAAGSDMKTGFAEIRDTLAAQGIDLESFTIEVATSDPHPETAATPTAGREAMAEHGIRTPGVLPSARGGREPTTARDSGQRPDSHDAIAPQPLRSVRGGLNLMA